MNGMTKKALAAAAVALCAIGTSLATASPATAAPVCNSVSTALNGGGRVCIDYDPQGYRAVYQTGGTAWGDWVDFNLQCYVRVFGSNGAFRASAIYNTYSYVFPVGSQGTCWVRLYDRSSGAQASSPTVTR
jgi:hypothetical protein